MKSTAETYFSAALEHIARAERLHSEEQYYLAHHLAGLAVECILRAYLRKTIEDFDPNHSLSYLAKRSKFYNLVPYSLQEEFSTKFAEMNRRWLSHHRYFSEEQVRKYLHSIRADAKAKGDQFKQNSRTMLDYATDIVRLGERKWPRS